MAHGLRLVSSMFALALLSGSVVAYYTPPHDIMFKHRFMWGTATSAYQIEGFTAAGGRTPSVWDQFVGSPKKPLVREAGVSPAGQMSLAGQEKSVEGCHDYADYNGKTVPLLKELKAKYYRMSISWTRVLNGQDANHPEGQVNYQGITHYKRVIQAIKKEGIEPVVTMWHWDTPQELEEKYDGFLSREWMPIFFEYYARLLLKHFGKDVKYWITLNDPYTVAMQGYTFGTHAPGRCSNRNKCDEGDAMTEPYLAAHTMLLSHGRAVKAIREMSSDAIFGIALKGDWCMPYDEESPADQAAAERCVEWQAGWFFDPIHKGAYPESMVKMVGDRLPTFTQEERIIVENSHMDVYFQSYYTAVWVKHLGSASDQKSDKFKCGHDCDARFARTQQKGDELIGKKSDAGNWLYSRPEGIRKFQKWLSDRYTRTTETGARKVSIIVAGNGWGESTDKYEANLILDADRCEYLQAHVEQTALAKHLDGADIKGYFAWSLMDNFEWEDGYNTRFGMVHVDRKTQHRTPKMSFRWFQEYVATLNDLPTDGKLQDCPTPSAAALDKKIRHDINLAGVNAKKAVQETMVAHEL